MEINLVKDVSVTFKNDNSTTFCLPQIVTSLASWKLKNVTGLHTRQQMQNKIKEFLTNAKPAEPEIISSLRIVQETTTTNEVRMSVMWITKGHNSLLGLLSQKIGNLAGLQTKIEISDVNNYQQISPVQPLSNVLLRDTKSAIAFSFGGAPIDLFNKWKNENGQIGTVTAKLSLDLIFDEDFLSDCFTDNKLTNNCLLSLTKMLENESECDAVIKTAGGSVVKCNRAFLAASSPYFLALFQSGMTESSTNEINMTDMSEIEVRALLDYLYKGDVTPALMDIQTAWTLLKAGNYYQLDELVKVMREILMVRKHEKYSVDLALEILLFAKDVSGDSNGTDQPLKSVWNDLTLKAVLVLKWYSKEQPLELWASEKYNKLYTDTPQLAMKLVTKFLELLDEDEFEKRMDGAESFWKML